MDQQAELKTKYVVSVIPYNAKRGYPAGKDLYYECPLCQFWMKSLPDNYDEAHCTCGNLSLDIDMGRFGVRDTMYQPGLLRLSPQKRPVSAVILLAVVTLIILGRR